jgi:hypothetical protein
MFGFVQKCLFLKHFETSWGRLSTEMEYRASVTRVVSPGFGIVSFNNTLTSLQRFSIGVKSGLYEVYSSTILFQIIIT